MNIKNWFTEHKLQIKLAMAKRVLFIGLVAFLFLSFMFIFASLFGHSEPEVANVRVAILSILTVYIVIGVATMMITKRFLLWLYRIIIVNVVLYTLSAPVLFYLSSFDYFYQSLRIEMLIGVFIILALFFIFIIFPMRVIKKSEADIIEKRPSGAALVAKL